MLELQSDQTKICLQQCVQGSNEYYHTEGCTDIYGTPGPVCCDHCHLINKLGCRHLLLELYTGIQ